MNTPITERCRYITHRLIGHRKSGRIQMGRFTNTAGDHSPMARTTLERSATACKDYLYSPSSVRLLRLFLKFSYVNINVTLPEICMYNFISASLSLEKPSKRFFGICFFRELPFTNNMPSLRDMLLRDCVARTFANNKLSENSEVGHRDQ